MSQSSTTDPHDNPQGPGDARPTAAQIVEREGDSQQRLNGKKVLLTGASSGIGLETAKVLASIGCHLYLPIRNMKVKDDLIKKIAGDKTDAVIEFFEMDLSDLDTVRKFVSELKTKTDTLNILIANAGIMAVPEAAMSKQGYELQFAANHLGHFLLFLLVKDLLLAGSTPEFNSRVVSVSSAAHLYSAIRFDDYHFKKDAYNKWTAYAQSKTANIYLATEIERRYGNQGLHGLALHPGAIGTNLGTFLTAEELEYWSTGWYATSSKSIPQGAATQVYAAVSKEWEGKGGKYLENCRVATPRPAGETLLYGHSPYAYDNEAAQRLWADSLEMVGEKESS